ncbi:MAG: glycosyltransferase family 2 protein [Tissierellia bacterium]|nr:glycosyltransferase family 2 protein [Tissierellia bacterium]MDD4781627.1 glycosyltransferase family 2 protein [Tissierellia bacterium]
MYSIDVSIIIVSFNTKHLTLKCIESIIDHTIGIKYEIIVVDNASIDGSVEAIKAKFPIVSIIDSGENIGFGRANNLGVESAKGKYLFFLNSDCILIENAIMKMYDYFEKQNSLNNSIGAIGCYLLDSENNLNTSYKRFPTPGLLVGSRILDLVNRVFKTKFVTKQVSNYTINRKGEVDFITGADLFILNDIFTSLNGFDPSFFMYYEETDLQKRMSNKSLKRIILKDVNIIHLEGGSTSRKMSSNTIFIDSEFKYIKKHYPLFIYMLYYLLMSILLLPSLFNYTHSKKDKKIFLKMILRNAIPFN